VHLSSGKQAEETARLYFPGKTDLVILAVNVADIAAGLKWEPVALR
jgi:uncharacterized protein (DUF952 family)